MGLAYKLDVEEWAGVGDYISNAIIELAGTEPLEMTTLLQKGDAFSSQLGPDWMYRFCGRAATAKADTQTIFPTGEYIVRDITFVNGYYIMVGSYKAYFRDLYGAGNHGYAWDGFIMPLRGYTFNTAATAPFLYDETTKAYLGRNINGGLAAKSWGFMPMRMPIDIVPGVIADAATIAADSSVGLQAIDIMKGEGGIVVGAVAQTDAANIKIVTVGFQLMGDPAGNGIIYDDVDYVGFMWNSQLLSYIEPVNAEPARRATFSTPIYTGGQVSDYTNMGGNKGDPIGGQWVQYWAVRQSTMQTSWNGRNNYSCPLGFGLVPEQNTRIRDLEVCTAISPRQMGGGVPYLYETDWVAGYAPNGQSWIGGPPIAGFDATALRYNQYPRRFLDVNCYSKVAKGGVGAYEAHSPYIICGDISVGGDNTVPNPTITETVPFVAGCSYPSEFLQLNAIGAAPSDKIHFGPYIQLHSAGVSFGALPLGASSFDFQGTYTSAPQFDGSYAVMCQTPYENQSASLVTANPSGLPVLRYIAVNGVQDAGGGTGCALFALQEPPITPETDVFSVIAPNNAPAPSVGGYPDTTGNKWYNKAMQSRTFSVTEENAAKVLNYPDTALPPFSIGPGPFAAPEYILNANNQENVGVFGNYQRYGLDDDPTGELTASKQQGSNSRQGFGLLGWQSGTGPITFMYDSGRGWMKLPGYGIGSPNYANPSQYSNVVKNVGDIFNLSTIVNRNDTDRKAICAAWDNDRDQWLFMFSNPTSGINVISADSSFTNTAKGIAFLDQTPNFLLTETLVDEYLTGMWSPFLMTNELDGLVIMGGDDRTNSGASGIFGYTGDGAFKCPSSWTYAVCPTLTTQTPPNDWGSGLPIGTIEEAISKILVFTLSGTTGREAKVWVDYILFDGADAVIATKLKERGMKVTIEAVEWFKRKIINSGELNIKQEEIEEWMRQQQDEFQMMMTDAERMGRVRKKKKQVSAYALDMLETLNTDFEDKEIQEFMKEYLPQSRPPTPEEEMLERKRKGGYSPQSKSYYDEVFEN